LFFRGATLGGLTCFEDEDSGLTCLCRGGFVVSGIGVSGGASNLSSSCFAFSLLGLIAVTFFKHCIRSLSLLAT